MVLNIDRMSRPIFLTANGSADQRLAHTEGAGLGNKVFLFTLFIRLLLIPSILLVNTKSFSIRLSI